MGLLENFYLKFKWSWCVFKILWGWGTRVCWIFFHFSQVKFNKSWKKNSVLLPFWGWTKHHQCNKQIEWLNDEHILKKISLISGHQRLRVNPWWIPRASEVFLSVLTGGSLGQLSLEQVPQCQMWQKSGGFSSSVSKILKAERGPVAHDWERSVCPCQWASVGKEGCLSLQQCLKNGLVLAWLYPVGME